MIAEVYIAHFQYLETISIAEPLQISESDLYRSKHWILTTCELNWRGLNLAPFSPTFTASKGALLSTKWLGLRPLLLAETSKQWQVWWLLQGWLQTWPSTNQLICADSSASHRGFQLFAAHAPSAEAAWQVLLQMCHCGIAVLRRRSRRDRKWCHSTTQVCCTSSPVEVSDHLRDASHDTHVIPCQLHDVSTCKETVSKDRKIEQSRAR